MDQHRDALLVMARQLMQSGILPDLVKSAKIYEPSELQQLPDTCFADPHRRMFTIHTPADTLLSAGYLFKQGHQKFPALVKERLVKAAYAHGIEAQLLAIAQAVVAPMHKKAADEEASNYALLVRKPDGKSYGRYLVLDGAMLKKADTHFVANHKKYPISWRVTIGGNLAKKAQQFGLPVETLHPVTRAYSGDNYCSSEKAAIEIVKRGYVCKDPQAQNAYLKLAQVIQGETKTAQAREQFAAVLDRLDKATGMDRHYNDGFQDPYKTVFNLTKEAAEVVLSTVDLGGDQFTSDELMGVPPSVYSQVLGDDFLKDASDSRGKMVFEKLAEILPTLPRDEKALLVRHLRHSLDRK